MQNDIQLIQKCFDELAAVAKLIENTEFLLKLRDLQMSDRNIMRKLLEFLIEFVNLDVSTVESISKQFDEYLMIYTFHLFLSFFLIRNFQKCV